MSEKINELRRLLEKVAGKQSNAEVSIHDIVEEIKTVKKLGYLPKEISSDDRTNTSDAPACGWFEYVLRRFNGEPVTTDWVNITLADLGDEKAIALCRQKYKNNEYVKFKFTNQLYEDGETENEFRNFQNQLDDMEIDDDDCDCDVDLNDNDLDDISYSLDDDDLDDIDGMDINYHDYSDDEIDSIANAIENNKEVYDYINNDDVEDSELFDIINNTEDKIKNLEESLLEETSVEKIVEMTRNKTRLEKSLSESASYSELLDAMRKKIRNFKQMQRERAGTFKIKKNRTLYRIPTIAKAFNTAVKKIKKALLYKFARVDNAREYNELTPAQKVLANIRLKKIEKNRMAYQTKVLAKARKLVSAVIQKAKERIAAKHKEQ